MAVVSSSSTAGLFRAGWPITSEFHTAVTPPSIGYAAPVMNDASSEQR